MVWARIPPDRLRHLPLFGIDVVVDDGSNLLWLRGPSGRMCVDKRAPRIWFDDIADAHQAGATAIRISNAEELSAIKSLQDKPAPLEAENFAPVDGSDG